jgi:hypothetical protein
LLLEYISGKEAGLVTVIETVTGIVTRTGGIVIRKEKESVKRRGNVKRREKEKEKEKRSEKGKRNEKKIKSERKKRNVKENGRRSENEETRRTATYLHQNLREGKYIVNIH